MNRKFPRYERAILYDKLTARYAAASLANPNTWREISPSINCVPGVKRFRVSFHDESVEILGMEFFYETYTQYNRYVLPIFTHVLIR